MNKVLMEIYSKENCQLCDELKEVINKVKNEFDFEIKEIDITKDDEIFEKYKYDIPVVNLNGTIAFKHRITVDELRKKLKARNLY